ncbi:thiamine transport system permease protein [Desulfocicer vacuolatum DSM 3385]|uniref:Thiamine transport system permease protein n=1 Tax=Desulfocicer vacuolatum DSM 3385 TaxID=1121400 RepID=A0A1W2BF31_9BACT|nr:iron ABC transporter permease [Desulfocicer vacuolatum]SMC71595.1 thiamine transport system permease protein [Desulfocicer vacuolatum DSM 3385]
MKKGVILSPGVLAGVIPLVFLSLFYFYPLAGIFFKSFFSQGGLSLSSSGYVVQSKRMAGIVWFTLWQAGVSTALTLVIALPCAYVMATFHFRWKKVFMTLATIPFVLPTIVVAAAFQALAGEKGILGNMAPDQCLVMIFVAHMFYNFSVVLRITVGFWSAIGPQMKEAGAMLGARPVQIFFKITLPLLKPAIFAASFLVFIFCFSSFGVILILGGPGFSTIEVEIYRQAAHLFNLPVAAMLSLLQIVITFALMWIYTSLQKRLVQFSPETETLSARPPWGLMEKSMVAGCVGFIICFCLCPMLALVIKSLWYEGSLSFIFYRSLFYNVSGSIFYVPPVRAMGNSLMFATATLAMALAVGGCAAMVIHGARGRFARFLDPLFMLPLSTSAVTLGFGMIITLDTPPLNLRTSPFLVPVVHTLVAFPFVVRSVLPALRSIPHALREAAGMLGASPGKVWVHVDLPIIARALTVGAVFAFTVSLGEFGATLFTARPEYATIPVAIYRFLGQPGATNYGQAMAVSSLLMLVTATGFMVIEKLRPRGHEGF